MRYVLCGALSHAHRDKLLWTELAFALPITCATDAVRERWCLRLEFATVGSMFGLVLTLNGVDLDLIVQCVDLAARASLSVSLENLLSLRLCK